MKNKIVLLTICLLITTNCTGCVMSYMSNRDKAVSDNSASQNSVSENQSIFTEIPYDVSGNIAKSLNTNEDETKDIQENITSLLDISESDIKEIYLKEGYPEEKCKLLVATEDKEYIVRLNEYKIIEILDGEEPIYQDEAAIEEEKAGEVVYVEPTTAPSSGFEANREDSIKPQDYFSAKAVLESWNYNFISEQEPKDAEYDKKGNEKSAGKNGYFIVANDAFTCKFDDMRYDISSMEFFRDNGNVIVIDHYKGANYEIVNYYDLATSTYIIRINVETTQFVLEGEDDTILIEIASTIGYWVK